MDCITSGFPVHQLLELAQTHVHRVGDAIPPSHSLLSPSPPTFNLSQHQGILKWSFSISISPSNEYLGLISFRIDRFDLLAVQGTLKSLLQHHSSKASMWYVAAVAAKSLQLCLTLCDPIDGSPPGSPVLGILQARTLEWVAISFSNAWK